MVLRVILVFVSILIVTIHSRVALAEIGMVHSRNYEQSIGSYAADGKLVRADQLQLESEGLLKIFRPRNRGFGSVDLVSFLENTARELRRQFPEAEPLQIGDTSQEWGGPISGHGSHQNGLDADLIYLRKDRRVMPTDTTNGFDEMFVVNGKLSTNFDLVGNWKLFSIMASTGRVNRIFVDAKIKKAFCDYTLTHGTRTDSKEILRLIRPWTNHADHLHVRLHCPPFSPNCVPQSAIPEGDGCDDLESIRDEAEVGC